MSEREREGKRQVAEFDKELLISSYLCWSFLDFERNPSLYFLLGGMGGDALSHPENAKPL